MSLAARVACALWLAASAEVTEFEDLAAISADLDDECHGSSEERAACASSLLQRRRLRLRSNATGDVDTVDAERKPTCPSDTGGSCVLLGCAASRGATECHQRRCHCKPGYCNDHGVCVSEQNLEQDRGLTKQQCLANTGGSCRINSCYPFRGETSCKSHSCVCKPGFCSVLGVCHREMGSFKARVVPVNQDSPTFPGASADVATALVMSGGGARSTVASMGVLRALEALGLMPGVDAISSVSGGSWAASVYMFANRTSEELLGAPTEPSKLTLRALARKPAELGAACTISTTKIAASLWWEGVSSHHLWVYTISKAILAPFGLDSKTSYMAPSAEDVARIRRDNPQLVNASFLVPRPGRPRTLVMSGAILSPTGYKADAANVVSLQMSPDFTGSPFYPDNGTVDYDSAGGRRNRELQNLAVGGGFVETFAWGGSAPKNETLKGAATVEVDAPHEPLSLAKAVGVSSAGPASALTQVGPHGGALNVADLNPRANVWPVLDRALAKVLGRQPASTFNLGDGGNIDNSGVLAMLQRRARRLVWLVNTGAAIPATTSVCGTKVLDAEVAAALDSQVTDKFGYWKKDDLGEFLTHNQVFAEEELPALLCDLAKQRDKGKAAVVAKTLDVQKNDWWSIKGGSTVEILFVFNSKCGDFVDALPLETRTNINEGSKGTFNRFPHFWPVMQNVGEATALTASQVNLLAAHAEYVTLQSAALFKRFLGPAAR